jgi:hypothetical protein
MDLTEKRLTDSMNAIKKSMIVRLEKQQLSVAGCAAILR